LSPPFFEAAAGEGAFGDGGGGFIGVAFTPGGGWSP
jgi:hypothetical protein